MNPFFKPIPFSIPASPMSTPSRIAVCSWSLQPKSAEDLIAKVKETGLSRVQLYLNPLFEAGDGRHSEGARDAWAGAAQKLALAGIEIVSGMMTTKGENYSSHETIRATGGINPDWNWEANIATAHQAAAVAAALGLKRVSFHAGFIPHDMENPRFSLLVERSREIATFFKEKGVDLLLETGQEDATSLTHYLHAVGMSNLGVNFDPANMLLYGMGEPVAALEKLMPYTRQIHIKDANPSPKTNVWGSEEVVGTGKVDWKKFFAVLKKANYAGDYVIEREAGTTRVADIVKAKKLVEKMG